MTTDIQSRHTPPHLPLAIRQFEQQPTAIRTEPSRAEPNSADHWPTRLNQFSFSILNLQNIVKILTAVINCIFNPPIVWRYSCFKSPLYPKFFNPPFYHRKRNFISIGKIDFFWIRIIYKLSMIKLQSVISISITRWFFTINYHYIYWYEAVLVTVFL